VIQKDQLDKQNHTYNRIYGVSENSTMSTVEGKKTYDEEKTREE